MKEQSDKKKSIRVLEYFFINIFIFIGIGLLSLVIFNVTFFNYLEEAFKDFTFTDIYYTKIINQDRIYKGPLVLINVEDKSRQEIAFLLQRLQEGKPKVIGLDIIFPDKKDSSSDEILKQTFAQYKNLVFPYIADFEKSNSEVKSNQFFGIESKAFINVSGEQREFSTVRDYYPAYNNIPAFTTAIMQMYDPSKAGFLLKRNDKKTEIRYFGNQQNFNYNTFNEVMNPAFNIDTLKNKIVLMGYLGIAGNKINPLDEDRFFTPLNPRLSGRSHPDMYGMVIHANILRMALDKDYIYSLPTWLNWILAFFLSLIFLPLFVKWYVHKPVWFHLFALFMQLLISIFFVYLTIQLYASANIKIESSVLLIAVLLLVDFILFYDHFVKFLKYKAKLNFHSKFFEGAH